MADQPTRASRSEGHAFGRRTLLQRSGVVAATVAVGGAGALSYRAYDQGVLQVGQGAAYEPWIDWRRHPGLIPLVAAATLAPNPHNSQAWLFRIGSGHIDMFADTSRNIGAIDPYRREKYIGLGAALENLVLAAGAMGYTPTVTLMPDGERSAHAARIALARTAASPSPLVAQIAKRRSNRYPYVAGKDVPEAALARMASLTNVDTPDARIDWFASPRARDELSALLIAATEAIIADPDQSRSDYAWFRQSWDEIQRQRDGITVDASGLSELTQTLAKLLPAQSRSATDSAWLTATRDHHTRTAAAYGLVTVRDATNDAQRLQGGRLLERVHLWTTGRGLALQHMNQLTERADRELELGLAPHFGGALKRHVPDGWQALSLVRIGYPTQTPNRSPRRAVSAVIFA